MAGVSCGAIEHPTNLPLQLTTFVARERELAEVVGLLSAGRLLTLTGSGGVGKTRLALQAAGELRRDFPEGVWLVELAPLVDPALLPRTLAAVLGLSEARTHDLRVRVWSSAAIQAVYIGTASSASASAAV